MRPSLSILPIAQTVAAEAGLERVAEAGPAAAGDQAATAGRGQLGPFPGISQAAFQNQCHLCPVLSWGLPCWPPQGPFVSVQGSVSFYIHSLDAGALDLTGGHELSLV
jgi:hypothetical protein